MAHGAGGKSTEGGEVEVRRQMRGDMSRLRDERRRIQLVALVPLDASLDVGNLPRELERDEPGAIRHHLAGAALEVVAN